MLSSQSIIALIAIVAAILNGANPWNIISWPVYADLLLASLVLLYFRRIRVFTMPSWKEFHELLKFGLIVLPAGFAMLGLNYVDRIFLLKYGNLAEVGVYALAFSFASIAIQSSINPIWMMYTTSASELQNQRRYLELQKLFDRSTEGICLVSAPILAIFLFYGTELLSLISTNSYLYAAPILPAFVLSFVFLIFSSHFETSLSLNEKVKIGTIAAAIAVLIKIALNFFLIEPFGIYGAAATSVIAIAVQLSITSFICLKSGFLKFSTRFVIIPFLYATISFLLPWATLSYFAPNHGLIGSVISVIFGSILYVISLLRAGGLHPEVQKWIKSAELEPVFYSLFVKFLRRLI